MHSMALFFCGGSAEGLPPPIRLLVGLLASACLRRLARQAACLLVVAPPWPGLVLACSSACWPVCFGVAVGLLALLASALLAWLVPWPCAGLPFLGVCALVARLVCGGCVGCLPPPASATITAP